MAVVLAVEVLIAGPRRLERASGVWAGDVTWASAHGLVSLLWLPVLCGVVVLTVRAAPPSAGRWWGATVARPASDTSGVERLLLPGGFVAVGQPVLDLRSGDVTGLEALARFPDGASPEVWFARAAAVGSGVDLELTALQHAFGLCSRLPEDAYLSVNASPSAIQDPRFASLLAAAPLPLARLVLEVTEHDEVGEYDALVAVLAPLRQAGVRLAVDDVGAGYASFKHVLELRPDIIKLDRSIVSRVDTHGASRAVVTALVLVALELGAAVTAEGVETEGQLATLRLLGVDAARGYLVGRPGSASTTWRTSPPRKALRG